MLVAEIGLFLLEVRGVRQQDSKQIDRGRCSIYGPAKTLMHKSWKIAGVIDVSVCKHDGIDRPGINGRRRPIAQPQFLESLKHPTVDQHPLPFRFEEEFRARNGLSRAKERQSHQERVPRVL